MPFAYEAIDTRGLTVHNTVEASSLQQAAEMLRDKGLFVTRLEPTTGSTSATTDTPVTHKRSRPGGRLKDVIFFTQQMSMLIRSGARVVQGIEVVESQTTRPRWREVLRAIRIDVEEGRPLSTALAQFPRLFAPVYVNIVAAGEASGNLGLAFDRLSALTRQQQDIRNKVIGAMTYPAVLMLMCVGVIIAMFTFILPRFAEMFDTMGVDLPTTTALLIGASGWCRAHAMLLLILIGGGIGGGVFFFKSEQGRRFWSRVTVRVPIFGIVVRNIIFAQICRIWGQLLDSKVGLVEAVELTRQSTNSLDFQELLESIRVAITQGESIGPPLKQTWLIPRTFGSAIATGEESGKLADALLFVAGCLEEENSQVLASLTRLIEPIMLLVMGGIVGTAAISLFLPMFDMAAQAGQ